MNNITLYQTIIKDFVIDKFEMGVGYSSAYFSKVGFSNEFIPKIKITAEYFIFKQYIMYDYIILPLKELDFYSNKRFYKAWIWLQTGTYSSWDEIIERFRVRESKASIQAKIDGNRN